METREFTIEEMLQAAEESKLPNFNSSYIAYKDDVVGKPPVLACVIGEAFLNLGFAENGIDAMKLSHALLDIPIDGGIPFHIKDGHDTSGYWEYGANLHNLSEFINVLNGRKGYSGKKRIPKLVRKYFASQLNRKIRVTEDRFEVVK